MQHLGNGSKQRHIYNRTLMGNHALPVTGANFNNLAGHNRRLKPF